MLVFQYQRQAEAINVLGISVKYTVMALAEIEFQRRNVSGSKVLVEDKVIIVPQLPADVIFYFRSIDCLMIKDLV